MSTTTSYWFRGLSDRQFRTGFDVQIEIAETNPVGRGTVECDGYERARRLRRLRIQPVFVVQLVSGEVHLRGD